MKKKLLLFKIKTFCYNSPFYFTDQVNKHYISMGWEVTVFDGVKRPLQELDELSGKKFDAILDFNSRMPKLDTTEDEYYLDTIKAPFYNWILDHPMFHHDMLKIPLKDYHVICLDQDHADYIRRWYPHIKSVTVLPLAGSTAPGPKIPFKERSIPLLFTGTYTNPKHILELIEDFGKNLREEMLDTIAILMKEPKLTVETAFEALIRQYQPDLSPDEFPFDFPKRMHAYFLVSTYITAYFREKVLLSVAASGIPITVIGHGWEKCNALSDYDSVTVRGPVDFDQTFPLMQNATAVLNIMPWFKNGCHDRVFSTMLNGAVSISDQSGYFKGQYYDGQDLVLYDLEQLESFTEKLHNLFLPERRAELAQIALSGQKKAARHDWESTCWQLANLFCKAYDTP